MKKNVWMLNHYANMPGKGMGLRHFNLAKELARRGYRVHIFASSAGHNTDFNAIDDGSAYRLETAEDVGVVYVRASNYIGNNLKRVKNILEYVFRLPRVAKAFAEAAKPDVIIASSMHPLTLFAGKRLAKKLKCDFCVEIRDLWPESLLNYYPNFNRLLMGAFRAAEKYIYTKARRVIFTMEGAYDYIRDRGWQDAIPPEKTAYINNGIDLETFRRNRELYQLEDGDLRDGGIFKAVYTGSIRRTNAVGVLLETARLLQERGVEDVKLLIWGAGDEAEPLARKAADMGLRNLVFKGLAPKEYVPFIVSSADLNLLHQLDAGLAGAYKYGSSQNKKFDYLAAAKPVLCTVRTNYDLIEKEKAGISLEAQSPTAIAEAILHFRDLPAAEYAAYCERAYNAVLPFDFSKLADKLTAVIES
ncbi:MAG: glycosyltransferase family 4 protein [Clostridiales Family XIII bacterium]|nr:glycosyltransferase family 4 protein [Clostridiales Family XIII bacterium]